MTEARVLRRVNDRSLFDVTSACKKASYPDLCKSLAPSASVGSLTCASIDVATSKAKEAAAISAKLMNAPGTEKLVKSSLCVCRDTFSSTADSLQLAAKNLKDAAHNDLMQNLSAAMSFTGSCADAFQDWPGLVSPVADVSDHLTKLVSNSLDLASTLKN
ncbi:PMEI [Musa troglodytarum]|uniref:PMEI n=1 Tax=Musa troglodytarum TaxID=320322 RepID=A0A9E7FQY9_9LILI|nr:PMEI [Musa troglodytarum]